MKKKEFEEADNLIEVSSDAVTISIEDGTKQEKQRKADGVGDDEDPLASDDKTEVWIRLRMWIFMNS